MENILRSCKTWFRVNKMRMLQKVECPDVLIENSKKWTDDLVATIESGQNPSTLQKNKYNHVDIKSALLNETNKKCAYCESTFRHVSYGDIEHILPKSKIPNLAFSWENLTIACSVCNTNKGDFYCEPNGNNHSNLVDPYSDNPDDFFIFFREAIVANFASERAIITNQIIKLDRTDLIEERRKQMDAIDQMLIAIALASEDLKPILKASLEDKYLSDAASYANSARQYIELLKKMGKLPF